MVLRLGAAICIAATMFGCSSSAFADTGDASLDSPAAEGSSIGIGTSLGVPAIAHGEDGASVTGVASMYNPYRPGRLEGGLSTASGERYDPAAWTAAIRTSLRDKFGVHSGKDYRPVYALIESAHKQVIVKLNDVGPLTPGRVIDLNERTMRYFDPSLERGIIRSVRVTRLLGTHWTAGPIGSDRVRPWVAQASRL
jgi:rare lipoprotein A